MVNTIWGGVTEDNSFGTHEFMELVERLGAEPIWMIIRDWGIWHDVEPGTNPGFLYQQSTVRDAVVAGLHLNIFNNPADRIRMANLAQTINVIQAMILTRSEEMILTPPYHVFDMYRGHQDATLLPTDLEET